MEVKTFEAFSMKEAIRAVRSEFGVDAVILNTKEQPLESGRGKMVQVTAAKASAAKNMGASYAQSGFGEDAYLDLRKGLDGLEARIGLLAESLPHKDQLFALEAGMQEIKILLMEALRTKDGSAVKGLNKAMDDLYQQLRVMGIDESRLAELIAFLKALPEPEASEDKMDEAEDYYQNQAIRWLLKRVKIAPRWATVSGSVSVQAFVGTTGSGKTATVAKLAAFHHMREKKKVLIVSFDSMRLAATEQMRIYAKVIGVPFEVVNEAKEIEALLEKYSDTDVVLIDTSGRSPKNQSGIQNLSALKKLSVPIDIHLVLSLTETEVHLDRVIRGFSPLGIQSLVFAKLDETWTYGPIFNLSHRWGLPLSYFGIGQRVPEDVERATRERVVERIFGL